MNILKNKISKKGTSKMVCFFIYCKFYNLCKFCNIYFWNKL
nr:MAG TPA: transcription factor [Caudoviricetes sp.]